MKYWGKIEITIPSDDLPVFVSFSPPQSGEWERRGVGGVRGSTDNHQMVRVWGSPPLFLPSHPLSLLIFPSTLTFSLTSSSPTTVGGGHRPPAWWTKLEGGTPPLLLSPPLSLPHSHHLPSPLLPSLFRSNQ